MSSINQQISLAPPSLIKSLTAGFEVLSNHIGLVLFPILLDVLLWAGPRLRISRLIQEVVAGQPEAFPDAEMIRMVAERLNLMATLRAFPVGVPSLMAGRMPLDWAGGVPWLWEASTLPGLAGLWFILVLSGLGLGTMFFSVVAQATLNSRVNLPSAVRGWLWSYSQVLLLALGWLLLVLAVFIPFSCVFSLLLLGGRGVQELSLLGLLLAGGVLIWLLLPLVFSPHGIFMFRLNVWASVRQSLRLTRRTFWTTGLFFLSALVLSEGLDILWNFPAENSWFVLVGILGHAVVTTSLLAASFVYYRDANQWLLGLQQRQSAELA